MPPSGSRNFGCTRPLLTHSTIRRLPSCSRGAALLRLTLPPRSPRVRTTMRLHSLSIGVDMAGRVIRGMIAAEIGPFKTGRGTFDAVSLMLIAHLINKSASGVVCNYGHQDNAGSAAALDAFMGRV